MRGHAYICEIVREQETSWREIPHNCKETEPVIPRRGYVSERQTLIVEPVCRIAVCEKFQPFKLNVWLRGDFTSSVPSAQT
jgi:hypothetical protein